MSNNIKNISFGSVTPITATKNAKKNLQQILKLTNGKYELLDMTDVYANGTSNSVFAKASNQGKQILFLITGKDYIDSKFTHSWWGSITAPTRRMNRKLVELTENSIAKMVNLAKRTLNKNELKLIENYISTIKNAQ